MTVKQCCRNIFYTFCNVQICKVVDVCLACPILNIFHPARVFKSCRFITIMHTRLKVPAKNSPALLFLSRGKEEERKTTTISCFAPAEEEQSRGILGGYFQTRGHGGNKAAGHKGTTCISMVFCYGL